MTIRIKVKFIVIYDSKYNTNYNLYNSVVEAVNAAVIRQEELEIKKENTPKNPTLDSNAFGNLVTANAGPATDDSVGKKKSELYVPRSENILGGIDEPNRYKTITQLANDGESEQKKKIGKKSIKSAVEPVDMISPITGQLIGDYGTWAQDLSAKKAQEEAARIRRLEDAEDEANREADDSPIAIFRRALASRGASGFSGLQRIFKILDDDNSKSLSLSEFTNAIKYTKIDMNEKDIKLLFQYFDTDNTGNIAYDTFITKIKGSMNNRRKRLVLMAYDVLDKDGSGQVDILDFAAAYDVSKHPDFLQGKKSKDQILLEFMSAFEDAKSKDGIVSRDEFLNYYTGVSANIDNDDYFELMIRNAWHISGGEGVCANTTNKRVLVTRADGTQAVEEVKNDLGLKAGDKVGILARLKEQGVEATNIDYHGESDDVKKARNAGGGAAIGRPAFSQNNNIQIEKLKEKNDAVCRELLKKLQEKLKSRGASGFVGLQRSFKIMDDDGSKSLDKNEFKKAMADVQLGFSDGQCTLMFSFFDSDNSGTIDYDEFLKAVRGDISDRRKNLILMAYDVIDKTGDGIVDPADLIDTYDTTKHPDVISGKKTKAQVLKEFLDTFDVGGEVDGKVTKDEFINYYKNISASIDSEDYFELMIRNAWHISGGEGAAANSSNLRVLVTRADGTQSVQEVTKDLGLKAGDKAAVLARLKAQGVDAANIEFNGASDDAKKDKSTSNLPPKINKSSNEKPKILQPSQGEKDALTIALDGPNPTIISPRKPAPIKGQMPKINGKEVILNQPKPGAPNLGLEFIINKLHAQLKSRGQYSFADLSKTFKEIDEDNSGALSLPEFKKGMREFGIELDDQDLRMMFQYFDKDDSKSIEYSEFLEGIRKPLNERRSKLINLVYSTLDKKNEGAVSLQVYFESFNYSAHPEVQAGRATKDEILEHFIRTFGEGCEVKNNKISKEEFINYYSNVGFMIDSDDYFELLLRSTWNLPAATNASSLPKVPSGTLKPTGTFSNTHPGVNSNDVRLPNALPPALSDSRRGSKQSQGLDELILQGSQIDNKLSTVSISSTIQRELENTQRKAVMRFNERKYGKAEELFTEVLDILKKHYQDTHPEIEKAKKSILVCQKKKMAP